MPDNRKFLGYARVRMGSMVYKIEMACATKYGGTLGLYRVRVNRRWFNAKDGSPFFFDKFSLADLMSGFLFSIVSAPEEAPSIEKGQRITITYWYRDMPTTERVFAATPPFRAYDGRYYVFCQTVKAGFVAVPCADIEEVKNVC